MGKDIKLSSGRVLVGDCLARLADLADASVDSIVTDPPYELGFMGKQWDASGIAYQVDLWEQCLRVLKPGGHLLAFGGTRTYHRMACAIEDAGFEIRDSIHWVYGSGFPKSLNVSKALEAKAKTGSSSPSGQRKAAMGDDYKPTPLAGTTGYGITGNFSNKDTGSQTLELTTDDAKQWEGWGTALKPAHEPVVVARKPLSGTVAGNVLTWGTGALNIDGCRVGTDGGTYSSREALPSPNGIYGDGLNGGKTLPLAAGRWPANIVLDETSAAALDQQSGPRGAAAPASGPTYSGPSKSGSMSGAFKGNGSAEPTFHDDKGGASRFFTQADFGPDDWPFVYQAKPSKAERNAGLDGLPEAVGADVGAKRGRCEPCGRWADSGEGPDCRQCGTAFERTSNAPKPQSNTHPTVKPVALMRHLVRLVTPPGGTVLDPFAGSGTTLVAAVLEGFNWIGCEMTDDYLPIIKGRVAWAEGEVAAGRADKPQYKTPAPKKPKPEQPTLEDGQQQ